MRLGLVGRGPQAQRYLMPKNGGAHIVSQVPGRIGTAEYQDWLATVDAVVIATHPAGHRHLALDAIGAGKGVLIEKPLALTLEECEGIIDAAQSCKVKLEVAHTDLWGCSSFGSAVHDAYCIINYAKHDRDYSPWLDWAPHGLALLDRFGVNPEPASVLVMQSDAPSLTIYGPQQRTYYERRKGTLDSAATPMWLMVRDFVRGRAHSYDFNRRVYRALFA